MSLYSCARRAIATLAALMALVVIAMVSAACGNESGKSGDDDDDQPLPFAERYLPLAVGSTWTWRVTPSTGAAYDKVSTVEAFEDVGDSKAGVMAFRVRTVDPSGETVSWQVDTGRAVQRHREQTFAPAQTLQTDQVYMPFKLRIDEHVDRLTAGASYTEGYTEVETDPYTGQTKSTMKSEIWTVEAVNDMVTVPAGTFSCLKVRRVGSDTGASDKSYWFAKGIGKIKEVGGQTEELASYTPGTP